MKALIRIVAASLLGLGLLGCATTTPQQSAMGLAAAVAAVNPELAPYAAQLEAILSPKTRTSPAPAYVAPPQFPPPGYEERVVYRYKDAVADSKDFQKEVSYHLIVTGDAVFGPAPAPAPPAASLPGIQLGSDEAVAESLAAWLDEMLKGK